MSDIFIYEPKTQVKKLNGYYVYNISENMESWSQRKSIYTYTHKDFKSNAFSFCNVTMMTMALDYIGYLKKYESRYINIYPELPRFPDKLAKFIFENKQVLDFYEKNCPTLYKDFKDGKKDAYGPNEIHQVLSYGTNLFLNCGIITQFSTNINFIEIINDIIYNSVPVGISGKFSGLNHIVLVVGVAYKSLDGSNKPGIFQKPDYFIIDDPYGKTYEYSKGLSGNDVWIPFKLCEQDFKSLDNPSSKFAHRFIKPENLGI